MVNRKFKASIIIHSYSVGSATWSAITATVPIIGPWIGDTVGLNGLAIAMAYSLANLFNQKISFKTLVSFGILLLGTGIAVSSVRAAISILHGASSLINAGITFSLQEATGWGLYVLFDMGGDLSKMTQLEFKKYIEKGKTIAQYEKEDYEKRLNHLPLNVRQNIKKLQQNLIEPHLTQQQREVILEKIEKLFETTI